MPGKKAFTLLELVIVVIIIGILAAIAVPMMSALQKKAIAAEAITRLDLMRNAMRQYYAEHGHYTEYYYELPGLNFRIRGDATSSFDGIYFSEECYAGDGGIIYPFPWENTDLSTFMLVCSVLTDSNLALKRDQVQGWPHQAWGYITMREDGKVYSDIDGLGYPRVDQEYW